MRTHEWFELWFNGFDDPTAESPERDAYLAYYRGTFRCATLELDASLADLKTAILDTGLSRGLKRFAFALARRLPGYG